MNVIWKRPDGFHGASPSDYEVIEVGDHAKVWLHRRDTKNFPFRVSGGWQDEATTEELNQMVNLLNKPQERWLTHLQDRLNHSECESLQEYLSLLKERLHGFSQCLKGDQWELEIMREILNEIDRRLEDYKDDFLAIENKL